MLHVQIPPTDYIGLIYRSIAVASASWSTFESTLRVLCSTMTGSAAEYR